MLDRISFSADLCFLFNAQMLLRHPQNAAWCWLANWSRKRMVKIHEQIPSKGQCQWQGSLCHQPQTVHYCKGNHSQNYHTFASSLIPWNGAQYFNDPWTTCYIFELIWGWYVNISSWRVISTRFESLVILLSKRGVAHDDIDPIPWKSKTIEMIIQNYGWSKFPT